VLLLRNKDQQQNKPLATFATNLCRRRRGHEWTTSSSLHNTITVNLTLVQCEFHTGKKLPFQESNQLIGIKMPTSGFSRNIWFLIPISRRKMLVLPLLWTPMRSLTILYQVPQTRTAHLMKRRNVF